MPRISGKEPYQKRRVEIFLALHPLCWGEFQCSQHFPLCPVSRASTRDLLSHAGFVTFTNPETCV
jgi:hypothetical protein